MKAKSVTTAVVTDFRHEGYRGQLRGEVYLASLTEPAAQSRTAYLLLRGQGLDPGAMSALVASANAGVSVRGSFTLDDVASSELASLTRTVAFLKGAFLLALCAQGLALAATVAAWVSERRRQVGIRLALGASGTSLVLLVMRPFALATACAMIAGVGGGVAVVRLLGTTDTDLGGVTVAGWLLTPTGLMVVALIVGYAVALPLIRMAPAVLLRD